MELQHRVMNKEREFLSSLRVAYKDLNRDPDLLLDKRNGHLSIAPWHTATLENLIKMVKAKPYEEANYIVEISYNEEDDSKCSSTMFRHYRQANFEIRLSEALDEYGVLALLDMYLQDEKFRVGTCGVLEGLLYEREQKKSS